MTPTPTPLQRRRPGAARRGSVIVAVFVILVCMMLVVGGIHTFVQQQIRQSGEIQHISIAKLQALYLVEMGVNQLMYNANQGVNVSKPDPFPVRMALDELGYEASEAIFVGDSPHDINAGNSAGVISIAALWGPFRRDQLDPANPAHYLADIAELPALVERIQNRSAV